MDIDAILENLNKAYDIDVESILNGLNAGLDDDQHIGPAFFASIMCGECTTSVSSSVNKSALSPVAVTEVPEVFDSDKYDSSDEDTDEEDSRSNADEDQSNLEGPKRSSEQEMKDRAFDASYSQKFHGHQCSKGCTSTTGCKSLLLADAIENEMVAFWGPKGKDAKPMKERTRYILDKLSKSIGKVRRSDGISTSFGFIFSVGNAEICESTYLRVVGLNSGLTMWNRLKRQLITIHQSGELDQIELDDLEKKIRMTRAPSEKRFPYKTEHSKTFIKYVANYHASASPNEGEENLRILPFETISQLYDEYGAHCIAENQVRQKASKETFRLAWKAMYKEKLVRFTRGKGTFPTCDICNNCNDMLSLSKSTKKWSRRQRDVIFSFKSMHLAQQATERKALDDRKKFACESLDAAGMPTHAVFFGDGMTKYASNTPKYGKRSGKKDTAFYENRVFGMEVYCGPVRGEIIINSDELVRGGANFGIEVHRQAMIQLAALLAKHNMPMPPNIHFQLDNCGENKNKEFFTYCAILVELGYFEEITVGFLIVGHTHASIDQYFSCLRKRIRKAAFIATPLALQYLFNIPPDDGSRTKYRVPLAQIQLKVIYDYKKALAPYHNKAIKNYGVPYQFRFASIFTKCYMQYKQYSSEHLPWLPIKPFEVTTSLEELTQKRAFTIIDGASICDDEGRREFSRHLGIPDLIDISAGVKNAKHIQTMTDMNSVLADLELLSLKANQEQELRRADEADGINNQPRYDAENVNADDEAPDPTTQSSKLVIQKSLLTTSSTERGFIFWIDYLVDPEKEAPMISIVQPLPINPLTIWRNNISEALLSKQAELEKSATEAAELYENEEDDGPVAVANPTGCSAPKDVESSEDDDDVMFGEMVARKAQKKVLDQAAQAAQAIKKKKKEDENKKKNKTDMLFIMHAVANMKAAGSQMRKKLSHDSIVSRTHLNYSEMTYREIFQLKQLTPADMDYIDARSSAEGILSSIDAEIATLPPFQWFPQDSLSPKARAALNKRMTDAVDDAVHVRAICERMCQRTKERSEGELIGRITNETEEAKARKALEKATIALLQEGVTKPTQRDEGIDKNDLCEIHLLTKQKKRCTRKAFVFIAGKKICRHVSCSSSVPGALIMPPTASAAADNQILAKCDMCDDECFDTINGKAYCKQHFDAIVPPSPQNLNPDAHLNLLDASTAVNKEGMGAEEMEVTPTANEEEGGESTGWWKETNPREAVDENSGAVNPAIAAKKQATTGAKKKKARVNEPSVSLPMRPLVPPAMPATASAGTKRRRVEGDAALEDSNASGESEEEVLDIIRINIATADHQISHARIVASSRSNGRRRDDGEDPFGQILKTKLLSVLSHRMYVDGLTKLAERLNLDCPTEPNVLKYVDTFVANFIKWYTGQ